MVDACMRSLRHSGWLNFRMRCLLVSFACYQLWLDWRRLTPAMARLFLDYEPGIHYPQFQMQARPAFPPILCSSSSAFSSTQDHGATFTRQAGTTGINANRIYSAAKQAHDHAGPDYVFIRTWCATSEA